MKKNLINVKNLSVSFGNNIILKNINLHLSKKESLVIIGKSGSGKSVLLKCLMGLLEPNLGSIEINGIDIVKSNKRFQMRKIKEFEASLLSKETLEWITGGDVSYEKIKLDIDLVKGLSILNKKHRLLNKKSQNNLNFHEIKTPYVRHLWKLYSTYGDNLVVTSDKELSEDVNLVLVNKDENKEINIKVDFYNEN